VFPVLARAGVYSEAKKAYDQQIQRLNDFFDAARRYKDQKAAAASSVRPDLKFEAMIPVLDGKVPVAITAERERTIRDALQFAEKQKIRMILMQPRELEKVAAELKARNIPLVLGRTLELPETEDDAYDSPFTLPAEALKAGLKFAFGTFDNQIVRDLPYNAATAVAFGLPYDEALKAVTVNAAEIWGVADQIGSIEKGKWADFVLATGDPLETTTEIKALYVKGKEVDLTNRQTRLYEKYSGRK
jgi:imidazolonepropionase-like amidohydrolase